MGAAENHLDSLSTRPFRALSIDGGGMRGIYTAAYLDELAHAFARRRSVPPLDVGAGFDLVVGTSTGAIVACALAAGVAPNRVVSLYRQHGQRIFRWKLPSSLPAFLRDLILLRLPLRSRALRQGDEALTKALGEVFGDETLGQIWSRRNVALCVTALEMSQHKAWVFKTRHLKSSYGRDDSYRLADICLASSAAPIFRSFAALADPDRSHGADVFFADGGLWANNPVLVALTEAAQILHDQPARPVEVFSLGTCPRPEGHFLKRDRRHWGILDWRFGGLAVQLSIAAQESAYDHVAKLIAPHLKCKTSIIRFPQGRVPAELMPFLDLDETSTEGMDALVAQAKADANETMSACNRSDHLEGQAICRLFESIPSIKEA